MSALHDDDANAAATAAAIEHYAETGVLIGADGSRVDALASAPADLNDQAAALQRRAGIVRMSALFLAELLQLPAGCRVLGMQWDLPGDEAQILVEGGTMPQVAPGQLIPEVRPLCTFAARAGAVMTFDWPVAEPAEGAEA